MTTSTKNIAENNQQIQTQRISAVQQTDAVIYNENEKGITISFKKRSDLTLRNVSSLTGKILKTKINDVNKAVKNLQASGANSDAVSEMEEIVIDYVRELFNREKIGFFTAIGIMWNLRFMSAQINGMVRIGQQNGQKFQEFLSKRDKNVENKIKKDGPEYIKNILNGTDTSAILGDQQLESAQKVVSNFENEYNDKTRFLEEIKNLPPAIKNALPKEINDFVEKAKDTPVLDIDIRFSLDIARKLITTIQSGYNSYVRGGWQYDGVTSSWLYEAKFDKKDYENTINWVANMAEHGQLQILDEDGQSHTAAQIKINPKHNLKKMGYFYLEIPNSSGEKITEECNIINTLVGKGQCNVKESIIFDIRTGGNIGLASGNKTKHIRLVAPYPDANNEKLPDFINSILPNGTPNLVEEFKVMFQNYLFTPPDQTIYPDQ